MPFRLAFSILLTSVVCLAGCAERRKVSPQVAFEICAASRTESDGLISATVQSTEQIIYRSKSPIVTNADVQYVSEGFDAQSNPVVYIDFTSDGAKKMLAHTSKFQDELLAVVVDGNAILALPIASTISSSAMISGMKGMTVDDLLVLLTAPTKMETLR